MGRGTIAADPGGVKGLRSAPFAATRLRRSEHRAWSTRAMECASSRDLGWSVETGRSAIAGLPGSLGSRRPAVARTPHSVGLLGPQNQRFVMRALVTALPARDRAAALGIASLLTLTLLGTPGPLAAQPIPLDPLTIPKFVDALPMPLRVPVTGTTNAAPLDISMHEFQQKLLPASMYAPLP